MANLYIIDQSLKGAGGHHLDYARCLAYAGQRQGFEITLGTHRRFDVSRWARIEELGTEDRTGIYPVFQDTVYQSCSHLAGLKKMARLDSPPTKDSADQTSWKTYLAQAKYVTQEFFRGRRRQWIIQRFADSCVRLFSCKSFQPGDHVFFAAVSELEMLGLAKFLINTPTANQAQWHLQFHFNVFDGRPEEYSQQKNSALSVAKNMNRALVALAGHSVELYTTSATLARQYNCLNVGEFTPLPYPVADEFRLFLNDRVSFDGHPVNQYEKTTNRLPHSQLPKTRRSSPDGREIAIDRTSVTDESNRPLALGESRPLRLVCPGGIRREKGQQNYLQSLVDNIWADQLSNGRVQLVVQRPQPRWPSQIQKIELKLPGDPNIGVIPVEYLPHPLPSADYANLIHTTDIGLLFYDSRTYYSRRAGILGELLACGKPVIVSAGNWLSDQIEEANFAYADRVVGRLSPTRELGIESLKWKRRNVPLSGGVVSFDNGRNSFEFQVLPEERERLVSLSYLWHWPKDAGVYCRIQTQQFSPDGDLLESGVRVAGVRKWDKRCQLLFNLHPQAGRICFTLKNAFANSGASVRALQVSTFDVQSPIPIGVVGVSAVDDQSLASSVNEIVDHYPHYEKSARDFSIGWNANHDPALTVNYLVDRDQSFRRAA